MSTFEMSGCIKITFTGLNNTAGGISVPGLKVGDIWLKGVYQDGTISFSNFEQIITVDDEIQQISGNYANNTVTMVLFRP